MTSSVSLFWQTVGNICSGLATLVVFWPLARLLRQYAGKYPSNDQWVTGALFVVGPLWVLLMGALLGMTASGGFDQLRVGRPMLYVLTVAAALALAAVSFVSIAFYIRPGFTPRGLYVPLIYLVPLATALLVVLSLNANFAPDLSTAWLRVPWTIFTGISLVAGVGFAGQRIVRGGMGGVMGMASRIANPGPSHSDILAKLSTLDPKRDFDELLRHAGSEESRVVRETVTAQLRAHPAFIETLAAALNSRDPGNGLSFLHSAMLSSAEQGALALPTRNAIKHLTSAIPAPNYMSPERRKQLLRWGRKTLPVIIEKFAGTKVDFSRIMPEFEYALRPDDTQR